MLIRTVTAAAAVALLAGPALAQQRINIGHLADYSGGTSDMSLRLGLAPRESSLGGK